MHIVAIKKVVKGGDILAYNNDMFLSDITDEKERREVDRRTMFVFFLFMVIAICRLVIVSLIKGNLSFYVVFIGVMPSFIVAAVVLLQSLLGAYMLRCIFKRKYLASIINVVMFILLNFMWIKISFSLGLIIDGAALLGALIMSINISKPLINWERYIKEKRPTINDHEPISIKRSLAYSVIIVTFLLISIFFFIDAYLVVEVPLISTSPVLSYGRPQTAINVSASIMIFYSIILGVCIKLIRIKYKTIFFIITEALLIMFAIFSLKTSYYAVTSDKIYYKYLFRQRVYNLSQVQSIKIPSLSNKSVYYTEVNIKLMDGIEITLKDNIDNENFINIDKGCINANRKVENELIKEHNDVMREYFGFENYKYIMTYYSRYEE